MASKKLQKKHSIIRPHLAIKNSSPHKDAFDDENS